MDKVKKGLGPTTETTVNKTQSLVFLIIWQREYIICEISSSLTVTNNEIQSLTDRQTDNGA